ncbi:DUF885 domain-containing protein [Taibaiella chishuiensis]|uniref:Uncharacterized protein (DUF885 family) n=1 Tax=Taibaiella chishuiensis TaxID=1434707 RepID=A0A2P8D0M6_9BACT|nr:DUF885 domain-containing protein [Taibaiella chishuiensis]PSK90767.1 uncharacterized protein (DUF885 family) [Taibaiella chishuiensis]
MRKILPLLLATTVAIASCSSPGGQHTAVASDDDSLQIRFSQFSEHFIESLWIQEPEWATQQGYHKWDSILTVPDNASRSKTLLFAGKNLDSLKAFKVAQLTPSQQTDYYLIHDYLEGRKWNIEQQQDYTWNPSAYNVTGLLAFMLSENYAPLSQRLQYCYKRMLQVPAYYAAAKVQLRNPVPELTALAIDQNSGGLSILEKDFTDSVKLCILPAEEKDKMLAAAKAASAAVKDYITFLKGIKTTPESRSFRLGKALYEAKFKYDIQSSFTAQQIFDSAVARKRYLHQEMAKLSKSLWPKYFGTQAMPADTLALIGRMIDTLSTQHVKPAEFQSAIEKQIPELIAFIKAKNLLYIDSTKPLVIRKEPAYMAGVAGASISAPGPYDKGGNTYYNVGSLEGWPAAKAESYLREYNHYILQILDIHEAIPGHYTQLVYANRSPSLVKTIFGNGAMIEGWAVYTEQMMLENGYGNNEPEMWLMWYKWHLRTVCNTILDYSVHVNNMSKEEALHLLTKEAFQQQAEAEGKWKRVSVTSVQLTSYFTGYKEIYDLREAIRQKEGSKFNLRIFHEKFLSYGSAPVKYISKLMLAN